MRLSTYQRLKSWFNDSDDSADRSPRGMQELEPRLLLSAVLVNAVPDQHIQALGGTAAIDLTNHYDNPDITGTVVRYDTVFGIFDIELFDTATPATVQNFMGYVDSGVYDGSFFHRLALFSLEADPGLDPAKDGTPFVLQGGGFTYVSPNNYNSLVTDPPTVLNEPGITNARGTIAMAKIGGDPDSATTQWFFNMQDNAAILDASNGGFTVFGRVLGDGMDIVDTIATTPVWNASSLNGALSELPLRDFVNDHFPNNDELVVINSIKEVGGLSYSVAAVSGGVEATVDEAGVLTIFTTGTSTVETATVTVEAEGYDGTDPVQTTITVNVGPGKDSLNGDGAADLIWRNFANGKDTLWGMQGFTFNSANVEAMQAESDTTWYIAGVGDFNQDGSNDLIWRNALDGQNKIWLMNGTNFVSSVDLRTLTNSNWVVGGAADFDNDGHTDILWRNAVKGRNVVWTMDGTIADGSIQLKGEANTDWYIGGVGDFNRDGGADIVWRNAQGGQDRIWLMNPFDASFKQSVALQSLTNSRWVIAGVGDYNQDNNYDIFWRNTNSGRHQVWVMDGTARTSVNREVRMLRNLDWQLPGRTSQLKAEAAALAVLQQPVQAKAASASAVAIAASAQSAGSTVSLLAEVNPIITLDPTDDEQGTGFVLDDDGQVVR
jgi:cyclophilin family peptidyl-prolyl cis-trans isomerase